MPEFNCKARFNIGIQADPADIFRKFRQCINTVSAVWQNKGGKAQPGNEIVAQRPVVDAGHEGADGGEALAAALEPADTNYYFYALGSSGVHHFLRTYYAHQDFLAEMEND